MIRDLLNPASGFLELREDAKGVQVAGLSEITAKSTQEVSHIGQEVSHTHIGQHEVSHS